MNKSLLIYLALFFSIISLALSCINFKIKDVGQPDYIAIIVTLLAIIVTVALAFSIFFNMEGVKKYAKEIAINSINEENKKMKMDSLGYTNFLMGKISESDLKYNNALKYYEKSLELFEKCGNKKMPETLKKQILKMENIIDKKNGN